MIASARATREDRRVVYRGHRSGYAILKLVSKLGAVVPIPAVGVVVNDAKLIRQILLDGEHFSKVGPGGSSELWTPLLGPNALLNMDGDSHAHLRRKLGPLFTTKFLNQMVGSVLELQMAELQRRLLDGEPVDITAQAERGAALVICKLTGYAIDNPRAVTVQLAKARELLGMISLTTKRFSDTTLAIMHEKLADLNASTRAAYQANIDGTVPALLRAEGLDENDTISVVSAMIVAGTETIVSFIPRFTHLLIDSGYIDHLAASPGDVDSAVNEGLRVAVPSPVMIRSVIAPTRVDRVRVRPGDRIILSTVMACQRAGDFNPLRPIPKEMRQLWFGAGAHFCIGMPLAMLEATAFASTIAAVHAVRPLRIVSKTYKANTIASSYSELVVQCTPS